ncbi:MAG: class I SAM-dependent methyltransferase [Endomicrobiia bacterium]|nr:class I SAM-dependent methyltransferase [Endomicrobiia bacterium]
MKKKCVICAEDKNSVVFEEAGIPILKCAGCGHVSSSFEAVNDYDGYFGNRPLSPDAQFWWNEAHDAMYDDFIGKYMAGKSGRLLDMGCGLGYFVKKAASVEGWGAFGCEISKPAADYAREHLSLRNIHCGGVEDSFFDGKSFDIITLWDVLEHIPKPDPPLKRLSLLLKDTGMLFIHTPNVKIQLAKAKMKKSLMGMRPDIHYLEPKDHLNIYSAQSLRTLLNRNGFPKISFIHLKPVQSVAGSKNRLLRLVKNLWFYSSSVLFRATFGRINAANLFAVAMK